MPLDPRNQAFLEQTGFLVKPGSVPREPKVLLDEERAKQVVVAPGSTLEPIAHVENLVIAGPAGDIPVRLYTPEGTVPFPILMFFQKN